MQKINDVIHKRGGGVSRGNISTKQYIDIKALYYICSRYFYMLWKVCSLWDGSWSTDPNFPPLPKETVQSNVLDSFGSNLTPDWTV